MKELIGFITLLVVITVVAIVNRIKTTSSIRKGMWRQWLYLETEQKNLEKMYFIYVMNHTTILFGQPITEYQ